jgi:hypothetical protein
VGQAAKFVTTVAAQLANTLPSNKAYLCGAIEEIPDIFHRGLRGQ